MNHSGETAEALRRVLCSTFGCGSDAMKTQLQELQCVFDKRTDEDDLKEILQLTHPKARHLSGWHLEKLAMGEFEVQNPADLLRQIEGIKKNIRTSKTLVGAILQRDKDWELRRKEFATEKLAQQEAMKVELEVAKGIIQKIHIADDLSSPSETLAAMLAQPAPVEARLLSAVQKTEASTEINIDLSETPSI